MPRKLIPPATFDTRGLGCLNWDINTGLSYDTKNLNGSGCGLFKILSQQLPAGTMERRKIFTRFVVKNRTLGLPNWSRIPQLLILRCVKDRVCTYWTVLKALVKKRNLIYMKAESAQQRWSSVPCSLSMIGSHALGKMKEKRSMQKGTK